MKLARCSGVLLHITSLPSRFGVGDFGPGAYRFADWLGRARQSYWQILPLNPTSAGLGNSPYNSDSAFAMDPLMLSPERLVGQNILRRKDLADAPTFPEDRVNYEAVREYKDNLRAVAWRRLKLAQRGCCWEPNAGTPTSRTSPVEEPGSMGREEGVAPEIVRGTRRSRERAVQYGDDFQRFCRENRFWLDDYALYRAIKTHLDGQAWSHWPKDLRDRSPAALKQAAAELSEAVLRVKVFQYLVHGQWQSLKRYCNDHLIQLIGDVPYYVGYDSADVWAHPHLWKLDGDGQPTFVAGTPPDYFSATGQLWGMPVYDWRANEKTGYEWWVNRMEQNLRLYDQVRIDHFRGFLGTWQVPAGESTAKGGHWEQQPQHKLMDKLRRRYPALQVIAEDLGLITPDVREFMRKYDLPGMRVLQFCFGEQLPTDEHAVHNHHRDSFVYTGTHDNNTARGWFEKEARTATRRWVFAYLGRKVAGKDISWELVRLAMMSVASAAIVPMQDILSLGSKARMNTPGVGEGNWTWRFTWKQLTPAVTRRLAEMTTMFGRAAQDEGEREC
jgi:4-alpha-glucanotransferase